MRKASDDPLHERIQNLINTPNLLQSSKNYTPLASGLNRRSLESTSFLERFITFMITSNISFPKSLLISDQKTMVSIKHPGYQSEISDSE